MSLGPDFIETTGNTVEEAISRGLSELGVSPAQVMIEVLEEPGVVFGGEKRLAKVRLQLIGGRPVIPPAPPQTTPPVREFSLPERDEQAAPRERSKDGERRNERKSAPRAERPNRTPRPERTNRPPHTGERDRADSASSRPDRPAQTASTLEKKPYFDLDVDDKDENLPLVYTPDEVPEAEQDEEAQVSKVVLNELLERMQVTAQVVVRRASPGEQGGKSPWVLDVVNGRNLQGRLVGRRGETLAALQYVTRLIASRELQRRVDIVVDVESYKVARASTLHNLALRMAEEAIKRQQTMTLEPMPPHERRIIHLALRGREDVMTKSVGEGNSRKVTIVPQSPST